MTDDAAREVEATRASHVAGWFFSVMALAPAAWVAGFLCLVVRVRVVAGHWPEPYQPDPKSIGGLWSMLLSGTLPLLYIFGWIYLIGICVGLGVAPLRLALREAGFKNWHLSVGLVAMVAMAILVHADPWRLRTWLAD